ncbi:MAG: hypothetical protein IPK07_29815 [Deltaproteobacteria bacterium]|nr:hypothetical protein [Deltaproteobacteria bacterium]
MDAAVGRHLAALVEACFPPGEQVARGVAGAQPEEAQVEDAGAQDVELGGARAVVDRREQMRRERDRRGVEGGEGGVEGAGDPDVGVEEDQPLDSVLLEEPLEEERLDRRVELEDVVLEEERCDGGQVGQRLGEREPERLARGIDAIAGAIAEQHVERNVRVRRGERGGEGADVGEVVGGRDGADGARDGGGGRHAPRG